MSETIKVLFLASDAQHELDLLKEMRVVKDAIRKEARRDAFELVYALAAQPRDLQSALMEHRPQIVHFAGHATAAQGIELSSEFGGAHPVAAEALGNAFAATEGCIRLVVLNACESHALGEAFSDVVDYTIGMNKRVSDQAAIWFAESFYGALAHGETVDRAFTEGVNRLKLQGDSAADIPSLRVRRGVNRTLPFVPPLSAETGEADSSRAPAGTGSIHVSGGSRVDSIMSVHGNGNRITPPRS